MELEWPQVLLPADATGDISPAVAVKRRIAAMTCVYLYQLLKAGGGAIGGGKIMA